MHLSTYSPPSSQIYISVTYFVNEMWISNCCQYALSFPRCKNPYSENWCIEFYATKLTHLVQGVSVEEVTICFEVQEATAAQNSVQAGETRLGASDSIPSLCPTCFSSRLRFRKRDPDFVQFMGTEITFQK
mmetsp:Transcript_89791/g.239915  ORF Transcript_89791/g.239915 Transcript_89791/m.239915 type:complete len:131 (+) Transcript_89791:753-1145(+)